MKATGIVRRIDDLGRVVIPKEIRRTLRIREGDPLEIYVGKDGEVIYKKYSAIGELNTLATEYAESLQAAMDVPVFICDRDCVVAVSGVSKKEYIGKTLSDGLIEIVESRVPYVWEGNKQPVGITSGGSLWVSCAMPIVSEGEVIGCVVSGCSVKEYRKVGVEIEKNVIQIVGTLLGKQTTGSW